ncbi:MAG TPA: 4-alpha-glucanotransferase [Bacteroidota bacterium]|nr:4-alpha-glucanotransferase [Bacteroidota bacterium]
MRFPRSSGVLLHPTSLPGPHGSGDFGPAAYHFIDWLVVAGQKLWQILPLGPVGLGNSPYMGLSAFAGNPLLIDLSELEHKGWIRGEDLSAANSFTTTHVDFGKVIPFRTKMLHLASKNFFTHSSPGDKAEFEAFVQQSKSWLDDYALFMALKSENDGREWCEWGHDIAQRKPTALEKARVELSEEVKFWKFTQWCFSRQWTALKKYANEKGIQIVGDIPIFTAFQSADVWSHPELFSLDENLRPTVVAGVPPDYFSATGQRWGNPLYRWDVMERDGFAWWIDRIKNTLALVDIVRIDHFRGFAAYWEIPAEEKTAVHGRWIDGPKEQLFDTVLLKLGKLPIIAEDLGLMTDDVIALRDRFNFPGMKVLQFAFAGDPKNSFLPHNYSPNVVVYTGTHDNDTTIGWFKSATEREQAFAKKYIGTEGKEIHWDLIRLASQSVADMAIYPMQDVLGLGAEARMNLPGKASGYWEWRFTWDQVVPAHASRLYELTALYKRCPPERLELPAYPHGKKMP